VNGLDIRGFAARYGGHLVLDRLSLDVPAGSFVGLVGTSGGGRSTLLRAIAEGRDEAAGLLREKGGTEQAWLPSRQNRVSAR